MDEKKHKDSSNIGDIIFLYICMAFVLIVYIMIILKLWVLVFFLVLTVIVGIMFYSECAK